MKLADLRAKVQQLIQEMQSWVVDLTAAEAKRDKFLLHLWQAREALRADPRQSDSAKDCLPTYARAV